MFSVRILVLLYLWTAASGEQEFLNMIFAGYQGWFNTPSRGPKRWVHWAPGVPPAPGKVTFELYPDVTEYPASVLETTNLGNLGNGSPSRLYSADTDDVIRLHMSWMKGYGIDGIALQRFVCELGDPVFKTWRTSVLERIQRLAPSYQRYFYIEYDISGANPNTLSSTIKSDWETIKSAFNLINNPYYAKSGGRPVVTLWGYGFSHNNVGPKDLRDVASYLRGQGVYLILGVPTDWRTSFFGFSAEDFLSNANLIQPWSVGYFQSSSQLFSAGSLSKSIKDRELCFSKGVDYQRVIWPGFAWSNWNGGNRNMIPRKGGQFFRDQFRFSADVAPTFTSMFIAMFDEFDESTAIAKAARDRSMIPTSQYFLTLDADGISLPSDHYLKLAGELTRKYHNEVVPKCDLRKKSVLAQDDPLFTNCRLSSANGIWRLLVQNNGHFALFTSRGRTWENSNRKAGKGPWRLYMQADGNLVFLSADGVAQWASDTPGKGQAPYHLEIQDDGNLVIYDNSHKVIWKLK